MQKVLYLTVSQLRVSYRRGERVSCNAISLTN